MIITFFGTYNLQTTPRLEVLLEGLKDQNFEVSQVNVPLPLQTSDRVTILQKPWHLPRLVFAITNCWAKLIAKKRHAPKPDVVLVGHLGHFDIHLARLLYRKHHIALDHMIFAADTARDRGESGGIKLKLLTLLDNAALKRADTIIVDTVENKQLVPERFRDRAIVVDVGASKKWFSASPKIQNPKSPLSVIFFGNYTPLHGAPTIGTALRLLKDPVRVNMIGDGQEKALTMQRTEHAPINVEIEWHDWSDSKNLIQKVSTMDVCLGIFGDGPKALRVVPNKVFQGAAAGCAIITSDSIPQRRLLKDAAIYVPPNDPKALARTIDTLAHDRDLLKDMQQKAALLAKNSFTPKNVVTPLMERLKTIQ